MSFYTINFLFSDFEDGVVSPGSLLRRFGFGFPGPDGMVPPGQEEGPGSLLRQFGFVSPGTEGFFSPGNEEGVRTFSFSRSTTTVRRPDGSVEVQEKSRYKLQIKVGRIFFVEFRYSGHLYFMTN